MGSDPPGKFKHDPFVTRFNLENIFKMMLFQYILLYSKTMMMFWNNQSQPVKSINQVMDLVEFNNFVY
jgi:hypothetical protein